jgi:hypothetical protein
VRKAVRTLERMHEDKDFKHMCGVKLSENPSQVLPNGPSGFRGGACSTVNVEPRDSQDEVAAGFTLRHEGIHARVIAEQGPEAVENERGVQHEIEAHEETVKFGREWLKRERQESKRRRIREEIAEEERAIRLLRSGAAR